MTIAEKRGIYAQGKQKPVCGKKQTLRGLAEGRIGKIVLAADADEGMKAELRRAAEAAGVPVTMYPTKRGLGEAVGIDVACGVVGLPIAPSAPQN